ncbi:uncharacterized protein B0H18DRAFT_1120510 [Fomitopsis serialis]|uniref:uncharacterized protein n=1 Tax=Fomitopsis serialis TaxID=139415 RepID=UPI002007E49B|nr:uncharacterized protein B0H18DRAFT_1120510 [Neoantrodia serialis]KAH9923243.1 hypothetical protein B0H18DRAFT_1120510 [Neoantrodia serialis]
MFFKPVSVSGDILVRDQLKRLVKPLSLLFAQMPQGRPAPTYLTRVERALTWFVKGGTRELDVDSISALVRDVDAIMGRKSGPHYKTFIRKALAKEQRRRRLSYNKETGAVRINHRGLVKYETVPGVTLSRAQALQHRDLCVNALAQVRASVNQFTLRVAHIRFFEEVRDGDDPMVVSPEEIAITVNKKSIYTDGIRMDIMLSFNFGQIDGTCSTCVPSVHSIRLPMRRGPGARAARTAGVQGNEEMSLARVKDGPPSTKEGERDAEPAPALVVQGQREAATATLALRSSGVGVHQELVSSMLSWKPTVVERDFTDAEIV